MSNDPIKTLTDTLTLLRVEIADVKKRQITEERLKHLQAALEDTTVPAKTGPLYRLRKAKWCVYFWRRSPLFQPKRLKSHGFWGGAAGDPK